MTDDDPETLAVLEEFRRGMQEIRASFDDARAHMDKHFAAFRDEAELSRRLEAMKLAPDHEELLYSLLTLPEEALELLREHLGITPTPAK